MTATQANIPLLAVLALAAAGCRTVPKRSSAEPCPVAVADAGVAPHPVVILAEADGNANSYREYLLADDLSEIASIPTPVPPTKDIVRETVALAKPSQPPVPPIHVNCPFSLPVVSANSPSDRKEVPKKNERHWQLPCLVGLAIGGDAQFPDHDKPVAGVSVALSDCNRGDVFGLAVCGVVGEYDKLFGASLSGFISRHESLYGISVAGLGVDSDDYYGVEASFGVNLNNETVRGIQFAGLWNESRDVEGIQLAGLFNFGRLSGIQISLISNDATPDGPILSIERSILRGMCGMGCTAATMATGGAPIPLAESSQPAAEANGVQVSLCANVADHFSGLQFALVANESNKMTGLQLAAYNRTGELHGAQIGIVNRACSGSGLQVGLINGFGPEGDSTWNPLINIRF